MGLSSPPPERVLLALLEKAGPGTGVQTLSLNLDQEGLEALMELLEETAERIRTLSAHAQRRSRERREPPLESMLALALRPARDA